MKNKLTSKVLLGLLAFIITGLFNSTEAFALDKYLQAKYLLNNVVFEEKYGEIWDEFGFSDNQKAEMVLGQVDGIGRELAMSYPKFQLLEIDGVPWQDSKYAPIIKEYLFKNPNSRYLNNYIGDVVMDKRFNGQGNKVWSMYNEGKTYEEVKQAVLGNQKTEPESKPESQKQPETPKQEQQTTENQQQSKNDYQIILTVDKKEFTENRGNTLTQSTLDVAPVIINGTTLVPLRGVVDKFGADISWDAGKQQVTVKRGDKKITLTVGSDQATINDKTVQLTSPAIVKNGRTLIPLRFVSEGVGLDINWDDLTRSILIQ